MIREAKFFQLLFSVYMPENNEKNVYLCSLKLTITLKFKSVKMSIQAHFVEKVFYDNEIDLICLEKLFSIQI
jgi:hypothetical protein